jgi:hypothetical protein
MRLAHGVLTGVPEKSTNGDFSGNAYALDAENPPLVEFSEGGDDSDG